MAAMESTDAPAIIEHINQSMTFTPYDVRWIPCSARFVVMGIYPKGTGVIAVYEMELGELKLVSQVEKPKGFKCGTFGASSLEDRHLATGDYEGKLAIWYVAGSWRRLVNIAKRASHTLTFFLLF